MTPPRKLTHGFTLIELLVVIAIIGILAGIILAAFGPARERAKITKLESTFHQFHIILTEYMVANGGTYPPAYGYVSPEMRGVHPDQIVAGFTSGDFEMEDAFFLKPWMAYLGQHNNTDLHDNFSMAVDTDRDGDISRLEYAPLGNLEDPGTQRFSFPNALYDPSNVAGVLQGDLQIQIDSQEPSPLIYLPINMRQYRKLSSAWYKVGAPSDPRPDYSGPDDVLGTMRFPPPRYDAYVLISVGPTGNTWGMIHEFASNLMNQNNYAPAYYYHVLAMATYFMATRDAENKGTGDGELDFDYRARRSRGQGDNPNNYWLGPNGARTFPPGPVIFKGEG